MLRISVDRLLIFLLIVNGITFTIESVYGVSTNVRYVVQVVAFLLACRSVLLMGPVHQIKTLVALAFLGSEVLLLTSIALLFPKMISRLFDSRNVVKLRGLQVAVLLFLFYCLILLILSNLVDFSFFTIFLWIIIFASYHVIFIYYSSLSFSSAEASSIFGFFKRLIVLQIVVIIAQSVIHLDFVPGDSWTGTSGNAAIAGFYLVLLLLLVVIPHIVRVNAKTTFLSLFKLRNLATIAGLAVILYFNDSKLTILAFLVALILYFLFVAIVRFLTHFRPALFIKSILAVIVIVCAIALTYRMANFYILLQYNSNEGVSYLTKSYMDPELEEYGSNAKFVLYRRIYSNLLHDNVSVWLFGAGPGKFASKTSNILAYDVLYKDETQITLPSIIAPYSSTWVKKYMSDLWTKKIAETSRYRSATLSFPFAGLISVKGEYGMIGLLFYLAVIYSFCYFLLQKAGRIIEPRLTRWALIISLFWFSLPLHMIFDNFQEKTYIMLPMILLSAVLYSLDERRSENEIPETA